MNWIKIGAINLLIFVTIFATVEISWRLIVVIQSCLERESCNYTPITQLKTIDIKNNYIGFSRPDKDLGYVPKEGFDQIIFEKGWHNARVSINDQGFRSNGNNNQSTSHKIIASGDSFTFGDQVGNSETWPSCLEKTLAVGVDNAGVFGYGPVQATARIGKANSNSKYEIAILSILVGHDLERDQLIYRYGFPKPYLSKNSDGSIEYNAPPYPYELGSKFNPNWSNKGLSSWAFEYSLIGNFALSKLGFYQNHTNLNKSVENPASKEEIAKWSIRNLQNQRINKKIVLLQYAADLQSDATLKERAIIKRIASMEGVQLVDTFDTLKMYEPKLLWDGHHTPFGNELICKILVGALK